MNLISLFNIHVFNINSNIGEQTMAANGISTQALKRTRQDQKLALANADRTARNVVEAGRYTDVTADATQLPTRYHPSDNNGALVDNANTGGLKEGRPYAA